jgi:hypothetical protein
MGRGLDQLGELKDDGIDYLKLRWASLRLEMVDKLSDGVSKAFGYLIFIVLILIALGFLMTALALWIGEMLGHPSLGFLIAGGGFLIVAVIIFFLGGKMIVGTMIRYFVDLFFTDKKEGR